MRAARAIEASDRSGPADPVDMSALMRVLSHLDDAELAEIEDDLNLFHFSGVISSRLRPILEKVLLRPL